MSEEILKALMQLFALAVKQDGGIPAEERKWVVEFLGRNVSKEKASKYMLLFDKHAGPLTETEPVTSSAFPSVKDSLKILNICESIGKTLSQEQKVVALIRLYELVNAGYQFTPQRINILNTVAEVFRINSDEFTAIEKFIRDDDPLRQNKSVLFLEQRNNVFKPVVKLHNEQEISLIILRIASTDLYFLRYVSEEQFFLNESPLIRGPVYALNRSSSVTTSKGTILNFSEVSSFFNHDKHRHGFVLSAENLVHNGKEPLNKISFTARSGKLIGILGNGRSGKSVLLRIMQGIIKPASGTVSINNNEKDSLLNPESLTGFVPLWPVFKRELTVAENMRFALSGFNTGSHEHTAALITRAIDEAGLTTKRNLKAHSLSAEQSKRLNIAIEAARDPSILFVEDPFKDLTSGESFSLVCYLRDLTRKGKLVLVSSCRTDPEIFPVFDDLIILDNGYMAYRGTPTGAAANFAKPGKLNEPFCPSCGNFNPDTIFRIIEEPAFDELGNPSDERMVSPAQWAALYNPPTETIQKISENPEGKFPGKSGRDLVVAFIFEEIRRKVASFRHYSLLMILALAIGGLSSAISEMVQPEPRYSVFNILLSGTVLLGLITGLNEYSADRSSIIRNKYIRLGNPAFFLVKAFFILAFSAALIFLLLLGGNAVLIVHSMFVNWLLLTASSSAIAIALYLALSLRLLRLFLISHDTIPVS